MKTVRTDDDVQILIVKANYTIIQSTETFQMDVSNYYPMKELLRDKYFDEGKFTFSWFFYCDLHLMQDVFLIRMYNTNEMFSQPQKPSEISTQ